MLHIDLFVFILLLFYGVWGLLFMVLNCANDIFVKTKAKSLLGHFHNVRVLIITCRGEFLSSKNSM